MNPDTGQNVQTAVKLPTLNQMLNKLSHLRSLLRTSPHQLLCECRHCGYSVYKEISECPRCETDEIASYNIE